MKQVPSMLNTPIADPTKNPQLAEQLSEEQAPANLPPE